jgi:hypothetical protein
MYKIDKLHSVFMYLKIYNVKFIVLKVDTLQYMYGQDTDPAPDPDN